MVHKTVVPFRERSFNVFTTAIAKYESKPEVGSSANIIGGSTNISVAIESRFISPPDIVLVNPGVPITVS